MCETHETHVKGPGGKKNSAAPRTEPELAHMNEESAVNDRKAVTRRGDRLALLDGAVEKRRQSARSFLRREQTDMGASRLAESDAWIVGLLGLNKGREYVHF